MEDILQSNPEVPAPAAAPQPAAFQPQVHSQRSPSNISLVLAMLFGVVCFVAGLWLRPVLLSGEGRQGDPPPQILVPPLETSPEPILGAEWTTYTDNEIGFSIQYPKDWKIKPIFPDSIESSYSQGVDVIDPSEKVVASVVFGFRANDPEIICDNSLEEITTKESVVKLCQRFAQGGVRVWAQPSWTVLDKTQINAISNAWKQAFVQSTVEGQYKYTFSLLIHGPSGESGSLLEMKDEQYEYYKKIGFDILSTFKFIR